ncbi:ATP-binding protein [Lamprobacter modestohalophilus]|uniref:ATP-binding protein n=1 Tax=Lamprobacter modestohalophilus TaxID=1064514 RepID=A0A9X1B614_9GAMM|nr:ATP-binding protein [Lamprobacter modestohalophilus]
MSAEALAEHSRAEVRKLLAERQEAAQRRLEVALGRSGIPPRFQGKTFADYQTRVPQQQRAREVCKTYAERFVALGGMSDNLLLLGGPGTGKTHLACAILAQVIRAGHTGLFMTAYEALSTLRESYGPQALRSEREAMALLSDPELLVLDELGLAIGRDATRQALLFQVLNARYGQQRATIVLGNLRLSELTQFLGERIVDRLCDGASPVVSFNWPSHRRLRVINGTEVSE